VQTVASQGVAEERKEEKVQRADPQKSVTNVNLLDSGLEFSQDQDTGLTVIKMYDRQTGQMIRQLPPEETLAFLRRLADDKKGVLVSRKL
jgi:flagellar protein FlaG